MAKGPRAPQVNPGSVCCLLVRDRHEFVGDPRIAQNINSSETKISVALERGGARRHEAAISHPWTGEGAGSELLTAQLSLKQQP